MDIIEYSDIARGMDIDDGLVDTCHPTPQQSHHAKYVIHFDEINTCLTYKLTDDALRDGRYIYAIDKTGQIFSAAPVGDPFIVKHTCFYGASDVKGAGEMQIENGHITRISNESGHFMPTTAQTTYTLKFIVEQLKQFEFRVSLKNTLIDNMAFF